MTGEIIINIRRIYRQTLRVLLAYLLIPIGFIFEYAITFPHIVMVSIDQRRRGATPSKSAGDRAKTDRPL